MTQAELDGLVKLDNSRCYRIARGAGARMEDIEVMLFEHKRLAGVIGKLG